MAPNIGELRFLEIFNDVEGFPTINDVAEECRMAVQTVKNKAAICRQKAQESPKEWPPVMNRANGELSHEPISESRTRFIEGYTVDDCIAALKQVYEENPERNITRQFFREETGIADSTWNRYFGTFQEFRRQAGLDLSRHQHAIERKVAIHASRDHYEAYNHEKAGYAEAYLRPTCGKYATVIAASDLHDVEIDPFYLRVLIDTCARVQPDVISLTGDIFDLAEFGKYTIDPREWDVVGRIKFVHDNILHPLREVCPDTQIDLVEGNHEFRLLRHLADATPALRAVLSDLHGMSVAELLGVHKYEVNYISKADLRAYNKSDVKAELAKNYTTYWDCFLAHHFPQARNMGLPGWNGHHHSHVVWPQFNLLYGSHEWHQLGCGHRRNAEYCEGERWSMGFAIANANVQSKATNFDYVPITDFAVSGGQFYEREESETYGDKPLMAS